MDFENRSVLCVQQFWHVEMGCLADKRRNKAICFCFCLLNKNLCHFFIFLFETMFYKRDKYLRKIYRILFFIPSAGLEPWTLPCVNWAKIGMFYRLC